MAGERGRSRGFSIGEASRGAAFPFRIGLLLAPCSLVLAPCLSSQYLSGEAFPPRCILPISAVDTITLAFQHTKRQLVQPFRFWQWTRLAVVGLLAGEMGSGGCNVPSNFNFPNHGGTSRQLLDSGLGSIDPALYAGLIAVLVVTGLVLAVIMTYISSVMRFILFDSVLVKECHIRQGWQRHSQAAKSGRGIVHLI